MVRKCLVAVLVLGLAFVSMVSAPVARGEGKSSAELPPQVIVKFKKGVAEEKKVNARRAEGLRKKEDLDLINAEVGKVEGQSVEQAVRDLERRPEVEYAEPDFVVKPDATDDARYGDLWGVENVGQRGGTWDADVDASDAWGATSGESVVVSVPDSGVDIDHPDLRNQIWTNPDEVAGNGIDDDRNGYADDLHGWDFYNDDASVYDRDPATGAADDPHGTHVAGILAAEGGNGVGIVGVAPRARIMPLKFLGGPDSKGLTSDAILSLEYAVKEGVKISNNSYGGAPYSQSLRDAIARADAQGHIFVAASGNGGADLIGDDTDVTPHYPASYDVPNVVSVAATARKDELTPFSNFGASSVDLAAPGHDVLSTSTTNSGGYGWGAGTSQATPFVAGTAALIKAKDPTLDDAGIKDQLLRSVDAKSNLAGKVASGGRLNSARAVGIDPPDRTPPETSVSSGPSGTTKSTSASFSFVPSEPVSRFECSLDGGSFASCASPKAYSGLASGTHSFRVRAVDQAGNTDPTPASRAWIVDAILPTISSPSPAPGSSTRDRTPLVRAVVRDSQFNLAKGNIRLYVGGVNITAFSYDASTDVLSYIPPSNRAYGTTSVRVVATDAAGNIGSKSWSFNIVR